MLLSEGQMSDYKGAALTIDAFPKTAALLGDKGYDADWFRTALALRPHLHVHDLYRRRRNLLALINES